MIWGIIISLIIIFALPQLYYAKKRKQHLLLRKEKNLSVKDEVILSDNERRLKLCTADGFEIAVSRYDVEEPKAVIRLVHGALEHHGRYREFISFLNKNSYAVIASDHRGHGLSLSEKYPKGYMNEAEECIEDMREVHLYAKKIYPNIKQYMLGHSMGSIFARLYLQKYDEDIEKLVLSGTVAYRRPALIAAVLAETVSFYFGGYHRSPLFALFTGMEGKDRSWISYNKDNLKAIAEDELIVKTFKNKANAVVFRANGNLKKYSSFLCKNPNLQILSISGEGDAMITGGERGLADTAKTLERIGYQKVKIKVYPNMRHEVLNEKERKTVYEDIAEFFEKGL